jgi:hypothetical protein
MLCFAAQQMRHPTWIDIRSIPVEDLASNGESVRAKVFHIACALCAQTPNANNSDQELIRDWCNMVSFNLASHGFRPPISKSPACSFGIDDRRFTGIDPLVVLRHQLCSDASTAPGGGRARQQSEHPAWTTGFGSRDEMPSDPVGI